MVSKRLSNSMAISKSKSNSLFRPSIPACFRPNTTTRRICPPSELPLPSSTPPSNTSCNSILSSSLYDTDFGLFTLTWSRSLLGHSLHLDLSSSSDSPCRLSPRSPSTSLFHLHLKSFFSWQRKGCKKITSRPDPIQIFWDFRSSKFGSGSEPESRFYLAVVISGEIALIIGDSNKEALKKINLGHHNRKAAAEKQALFLKREHFIGNRAFVTKARFGGADKEIRIEYCNEEEDPVLCFSFDSKSVLKVCHLKWKFRGNERIEIENVVVNISWDIYNWLFDKKKSNNDIDGHAVFMFNFEKLRFNHEEFEDYNEIWNCNTKQSIVRGNHDAVMCSSASFGTMSGFERKKLRRKESLMKSSKSLSSSSISSTTSSGCNSVMEWASMEEKDLESTTGFSLLFYVWKS